MTHGRISFTDNPWPAGHPLEKIGLSIGADDEGDLRLHLHVESAPYDAEGPGIPAPAAVEAAPGEAHGATESRLAHPSVERWNDPETWKQYRSAILSSSKWGNAGIKLPWPAEKFTEDLLGTQEFTADPIKSVDVEGTAEDLAVGAYVLGQDLVADHHVTLTRTAPNTYDLRWTGAVAPTFIGEESFDSGRRFEVVATEVRLS